MPPFPRAPSEVIRRLSLPREPEPAQPHPFPMLATIAPVFASIALWWITGSPFALVFAALGPVVAIASLFDGRLTARRTNRRETARFTRDCEAAATLIGDLHEGERADLASLAPGSRELFDRAVPHPDRWQTPFGGALAIRLGRGDTPSALEIQADADGIPAVGEAGPAQTLAALRLSAGVVGDAPIVVDARLGIGIFGSRVLLAAAGRSVAVQIAAALSPSSCGLQVRGDDPHFAWLFELPQSVGGATDQRAAADSRATVTLSFTGSDHSAGQYTLALASTWEQLPRGVRVVMRLSASGATLVRHPDLSQLGELQPDYAGERETLHWARQQRALAQTEGLAVRREPLPDAVDLAALLEVISNTGDPHTTQPTTRGGLGCAFGLGDSGPVWIDLVHDGPHAIVGGTTGSGKSELLVSWMVAMAASRPPSEVCFLFVDFKGGAAFEPLRGLPHCVGVITDLVAHEATRALASLTAEVRYRERALATAGLRSIDDAPPGTVLPRLVIVVDEYAAMVDEHPDLHLVFADLAARGRSLGMHVILCTQRPAGVVRDGILANCGLRISLRVNNRADSQAVLGVDGAATLPHTPPGRAIVMLPPDAAHLFQVAQTSSAVVLAVIGRWRGSDPPRAPWCAPLPAIVQTDDIDSDAAESAAGGIPFALADLPREQRRAVVAYIPATHGNMLILGAAASGKSGVLAALAARPALRQEHPESVRTVTLLGASLPQVWDTVTSLLEQPAAPRLLLIDDLDMLLSATPDDYSTALGDLLTRLLREGPGGGLYTVIAVQRLSGLLHSLGALCASTLLMRMPNRQEHILAGGEPGTWDSGLAAGGGHWRGNRLQVVAVEPSSRAPMPATASRAVDLADGTSFVAVSTRPRVLAERVRLARPEGAVVDLGAIVGDPRELLVSRAAGGQVVIGDPDSWQSRWGSLGAVRATTSVLFDGCSASEFRTLTGIRELPPPVERGQRPLWLLDPAGTVERVHLTPVSPPM